MVLYNIFSGFSMFLQIIVYLLWGYCILSWILPPFNKLMMALSRVIDPLLRPIRNLLFRIFPRLPLDFSPIILSLLISVARQLIWRLYILIAF